MRSTGQDCRQYILSFMCKNIRALSHLKFEDNIKFFLCHVTIPPLFGVIYRSGSIDFSLRFSGICIWRIAQYSDLQFPNLLTFLSEILWILCLNLWSAVNCFFGFSDPLYWSFFHPGRRTLTSLWLLQMPEFQPHVLFGIFL